LKIPSLADQDARIRFWSALQWACVAFTRGLPDLLRIAIVQYVPRRYSPATCIYAWLDWDFPAFNLVSDFSDLLSLTALGSRSAWRLLCRTLKSKFVIRQGKCISTYGPVQTGRNIAAAKTAQSCIGFSRSLGFTTKFSRISFFNFPDLQFAGLWMSVSRQLAPNRERSSIIQGQNIKIEEIN